MILEKRTWKPKKQMVVYILFNSLKFTGKLSSRPNTDRWTTAPGTCKLHSITTVPKKMVLNIVRDVYMVMVHV